MSRRRSIRSVAPGTTIAALAPALALALAAAGCGGSKRAGTDAAASTGGASANYLAAVTRAAYATDQVPGYKFAVTTTTRAGGNSVVVTGQGSINDRGSEGAASLQADGKTIEEVIEKPYLYVKVPSGSGTSATQGKPWVRADLSTFSQSFGSSSFGAGSSNPTEVLSYLKAAGAVTRAGQGNVRGVDSTHYHAEIDLAHFASAAPAKERAAARRAGQAFERITGAKKLPMEVWIGDGRVTRVSLSFSLCAPEGRVQEAIDIDLYDYGRQPVVAPPPASQVSDVDAKIKADLVKGLAQLSCH
jgi:hypothetical protein